MTKYVILSVNENPKYLYYVPLVFWAWRHFDWVPKLFSSGDPWSLHLDLIRRTFDKFHEGMTAQMKQLYKFDYAQLNEIDGYKSETVAQLSRLYGACLVPDDSYLMTSDIDMLPLTANAWRYEGHRVLSIGRDLTDYHYPICYVGARAYVWRTFMKFIGNDYQSVIERDIRHQKNEWILDQDILTEKLLSYGVENINKIDRGTDKRTGYPIGRVDRSHWTLDHPKYIDAHLPHDILTNEKSFHNVTELLRKIWPTEDFNWYYQFHKEFKKLL